MNSTHIKPKKTVEVTFRVRYAETDQMGIVHHASYIVWLEEGRSQWMRENGRSYAEFEANGLRLAVSELNIRYKQAACYDQHVTVRCHLDEIHSRQMQFGYEVIDPITGDIFTTGYSKHICLDIHNKVARIPTEWRAMWSQAAAST
ncbi:MAG: acyl-CoA thioesterase [Anaerolineae bacterium]|nr:acyl-CoA thioesterase [Anaerolineae bacterium]